MGLRRAGLSLPGSPSLNWAKAGAAVNRMVSRIGAVRNIASLHYSNVLANQLHGRLAAGTRDRNDVFGQEAIRLRALARQGDFEIVALLQDGLVVRMPPKSSEPEASAGYQWPFPSASRR